MARKSKAEKIKMISNQLHKLSYTTIQSVEEMVYFYVSKYSTCDQVNIDNGIRKNDFADMADSNQNEKEVAMAYLKKNYGSIKDKVDKNGNVRLEGRYPIKIGDKYKSKTTVTKRVSETMQEFIDRHHIWVDDYRKELKADNPKSVVYTLHSMLDLFYEKDCEKRLRAGRKREKGKISQSTLKQYRLGITHIKAHFPDKPLDELKPLELLDGSDSVMTNKTNKNHDMSRTRENVDATLYRALVWAVDMELMEKDFAKRFKKYKHDREGGIPFTRADQTRILDYIKKYYNKYYYHFLTYFWTGVRPHELLEIRHCDFDFFNNTIYVDGTKTETSTRTIPLLKPLREIHSIIKAGLQEKIFNVTDNYLRMVLRSVLLALGIAKTDEISDNDDDHQNKYTLKSTRHSFATRMREDGMDIKVISDCLGHTNTQMTDKYSHVLGEFVKQQADKVNALYA